MKDGHGEMSGGATVVGSHGKRSSKFEAAEPDNGCHWLPVLYASL